jgi:hypothetical protein
MGVDQEDDPILEPIGTVPVESISRKSTPHDICSHNPEA